MHLEPPIWFLIMGFAGVIQFGISLGRRIDRQAVRREAENVACQARFAPLKEAAPNPGVDEHVAFPELPAVDPSRDEHVAFPEAWDLKPIDAGPVEIVRPWGPPDLSTPRVVHDSERHVTYVDGGLS